MAKADIKLEYPYNKNISKVNEQNIEKLRKINKKLDKNQLRNKIIKFERYSREYFFQIDLIDEDIVKMSPIRKISYNAANNKGINNKRTTTMKDIKQNAIFL